MAARVQSSLEVPKKTGLNWFMPALVKRMVGSSWGIVGEEDMIRWFWDLKKSKKALRMFSEFMGFFSLAKFSYDGKNIA